MEIEAVPDWVVLLWMIGFVVVIITNIVSIFWARSAYKNYEIVNEMLIKASFVLGKSVADVAAVDTMHRTTTFAIDDEEEDEDT